jgi:hypothetical protein
MEIEKLEKLAGLVLMELSNYDQSNNLRYYKTMKARVQNLLSISNETLPDHHEFFKCMYTEIGKELSSFEIGDAVSVIQHLLNIIDIEKSSELKIKEDKIFEGVEDKLKQASISFRKGDYSSVFHTLNTALELVLKDKVEIPTTLTGINTSNVIELLVKEKVYCYQYLDEAKKRITLIDNKIKHTGYSPSQPECITALKAMQDLTSKLKNTEIKISEELRNKIFESLYDRKGKSKS